MNDTLGCDIDRPFLERPDDIVNACTLQQARAAKHKAMELFRGTVTVVGIGITRIEDGYGLKVNLERLPESPLPTEVDGVPLRVEIVGSIRKREITEGR